MTYACVSCPATFATAHGFGNHRRWHRGPSVEERFRANAADVRTATGCLPWTGTTDQDGYGKLWVDGKNRRSNRLALELAMGRKLAPNECALHACDNPPCVRVGPGHLFVGTNLDNIADRHTKGRDPRGERNRHAKLTPEQVLLIRRRLADRERAADLAAEYRVSPSTIKNVGTRITWRHLVPA